MKNKKMMKNNMKKLTILALMIGSFLIVQNSFAQKGKITSAMLNMQDGKPMEAKKDIDIALADSAIQKRVCGCNVICRLIDHCDLGLRSNVLQRERGAGKERPAHNRHAPHVRHARNDFAQRTCVAAHDEALERR